MIITTDDAYVVVARHHLGCLVDLEVYDVFGKTAQIEITEMPLFQDEIECLNIPDDLLPTNGNLVITVGQNLISIGTQHISVVEFPNDANLMVVPTREDFDTDQGRMAVFKVQRLKHLSRYSVKAPRYKQVDVKPKTTKPLHIPPPTVGYDDTDMSSSSSSESDPLPVQKRKRGAF